MPGFMDRAGRKQEQVPCALAGLLLPGEPEPCTVMGTLRRAGENAWNCGDTREERKKMPGIVGTLRRRGRKCLELWGHSGGLKKMPGIVRTLRTTGENSWKWGDTQEERKKMPGIVGTLSLGRARGQPGKAKCCQCPPEHHTPWASGKQLGTTARRTVTWVNVQIQLGRENENMMWIAELT